MNYRILLMTVAIGASALMSTHSASAALPGPGTLIKGSGSAVYWYGSDGKRYVYPNEKTYFSWYSNFSSVQTISDADLASIMIGGNVTYRPGIRMLKINTDPKVYAVEKGGVLRWVQTESLAIQLYGSDWNKKIDDVSDAFFVNYTLGASVTTPADYSPSAAMGSVGSFDDDRVTVVFPPPNNPPVNPPPPTGEDTIQAGLVEAGAQNVALARFRLSALNEDLRLSKVRIALVSGANAVDVLRVRLYDDQTLVGGPVAVDASGHADFSNVSFVIPRNSSNTLTVAVDLNTVAGGARVNDNVAVLMHVPATDDGTYEVRGVTSGTVIRSGSGGDIIGTQKLIRETITAITNVALPTTVLNNGENVAARFTVPAGSAEQISLKKITFNVSKSMALGISSPVLRETGSGSNITATATVDPACAASAGTTCIVSLVFNSEQTIAAGMSKTYDLRLTATGVVSSTSVAVNLIGDNAAATGQLSNSGAGINGSPYNFIWSDNSAIPHNDTDSGSNDWSSGIYLPGLPNDVQVLNRP